MNLWCSLSLWPWTCLCVCHRFPQPFLQSLKGRSIGGNKLTLADPWASSKCYSDLIRVAILALVHKLKVMLLNEKQDAWRHLFGQKVHFKLGYVCSDPEGQILNVVGYNATSKTILTNFIYPLKLSPSQPASQPPPPPPNPLSLLQAPVTLKSVWRKAKKVLNGEITASAH